MNTKRELAAGLTVAALVATLAGTSAFAESRPQNETRRRSGGQITVRGDRADRGTTVRRSDESRTERRRSDESRERSAGRIERRSGEQRQDAQVRGERREAAAPRATRERGVTQREAPRRDAVRREGVRRDEVRGTDRRSTDARGNSQWRGDSRSNSSRGGSYNRNRSSEHQRYGNRQPYRAHGRVSRVSPYRGGYHVWVAGARYPFFVPHRYYNRNRFRIGIVIGLGGYYNPLGYYDYYDDRYYDRGSYNTRSTRGEMSGTVESVDYRRYTFVMRNDATGSFVTIHSRDRNVDVRPGDYVEVRGNWRRTGLFEAYDVDLLD